MRNYNTNDCYTLTFAEGGFVATGVGALVMGWPVGWCSIRLKKRWEFCAGKTKRWELCMKEAHSIAPKQSVFYLFRWRRTRSFGGLLRWRRTRSFGGLLRWLLTEKKWRNHSELVSNLKRSTAETQYKQWFPYVCCWSICCRLSSNWWLCRLYETKQKRKWAMNETTSSMQCIWLGRKNRRQAVLTELTWLLGLDVGDFDTGCWVGLDDGEDETGFLDGADEIGFLVGFG